MAAVVASTVGSGIGASVFSNIAGEVIGNSITDGMDEGGSGLLGQIAQGIGSFAQGFMDGDGNPFQNANKKRKHEGPQGHSCSCSGGGQAAKKKYTCEEKCAYGRQMGAKCKGCRPYFRRYSSKCGSTYKKYSKSSPYSYKTAAAGGGGGAYPGAGSTGGFLAPSQTKYKPKEYKKDYRQARRANRRTRRRNN